MTTTATATLTQPQLEAAYRMARAYGHEWTRWVRVSDTWREQDEPRQRALLVAPITPEQIETAVLDAVEAVFGERYSPNWIGPVQLAPWLDGPFGDDVVHQTLTGRTTWSVDPHGAIRMSIARPGGVHVLHASFTPDADPAVQAGPVRIGESAGGAYYRRHVAALAVALHAATGWSWEDVAAEIAAADLTVTPDEPKVEEDQP